MTSSSDQKVQDLSASDRLKLASILSRLESNFDGERAAAGLLATAFLKKHNLSWSDLTLLRPAVKEKPEAAEPPKAAPEAPAAPRYNRDRRLNSNRTWRGYCRRRLVVHGQALSLSA